jgi:hypothetical protein
MGLTSISEDRIRPLRRDNWEESRAGRFPLRDVSRNAVSFARWKENHRGPFMDAPIEEVCDPSSHSPGRRLWP